MQSSLDAMSGIIGIVIYLLIGFKYFSKNKPARACVQVRARECELCAGDTVRAHMCGDAGRCVVARGGGGGGGTLGGGKFTKLSWCFLG